MFQPLLNQLYPTQILRNEDLHILSRLECRAPIFQKAVDR